MAGALPACPAGPPEPPPPPIRTSRSLWEPGGDPEALRAAADAWRVLAGALRDVADGIDAGARALGSSWSGEAHDAFVGYWTTLHGSLRDGADHAEEIAGTLEQIAGEIERVNREVQQLYAAIAATAAVSILASVVTFGASTAAGAAMAAANVARATTLVNGLASFLSAMRVGFSVARFVRFWQLWGLVAGANAGAVAAVKAAGGANPFDPDEWRVRDLTGVIVTTNATVLAGGALGPGVAAGATGSAGGSVLNDVWLDGRDLFSPQVGVNALVNAATGALASAATTRTVQAPGPPPPPRLGDPLVPDLVVVRGSGTARSLDDLYLPGRPPPVPAAAPRPHGPVLWLPGETAPRPVLPPPRAPTISRTLTNPAAEAFLGSSAGGTLSWGLFGGPEASPPPSPPPVPVAAGR